MGLTRCYKTSFFYIYLIVTSNSGGVFSTIQPTDDTYYGIQ